MGEFDNIRIPWPGWEIKEKLGEGGYGKVYRIERTRHGVEESDALKIIRIPQNRQEYDHLLYSMTSEDNVNKYLSERKDKLINEIKEMKKVEDNDNIVSIKDWDIVKMDDGYSWEIYIREDALTPFIKYAKGRNLEEKEVVRLGMDICKALKECEEKNIVHRDIKPGNILVSPSGKFMLTDFGIARELENDTTMTVGMGTDWYIAPEVAHGERADKSVDIYSLGLVLYELLNNNRPPFLKAEGAVTALERNAAKQRRLNGEELPEPAHGSDGLKRIVLKAAMANRSRRYKSAQAMLDDLGYHYANMEEIKEFEAPKYEDQTEDIYFTDEKADDYKEDIYLDMDIVREEPSAAVETEPADAQPEIEALKRRLNELVGTPEEVTTTDEVPAPAVNPVPEHAENSPDVVEDENKDPEAPEKKKNRILRFVIFAALVVAVGTFVFTFIKPENNPKIKTAYKGFKAVATENGWEVDDMFSTDMTYAISEVDKTVDGTEELLLLDVYFYRNEGDYVEKVNYYKESYAESFVNSDLYLDITSFNGEEILNVTAFKDKMIIEARVSTNEERDEVYNLLEALGIDTPSAISGHYLEETESLGGWNCRVYELDEPIVNAEWVEIGTELSDVEGDPEGSYKLMFRSDGSWDNYWKVDIDEAYKLYINRYNLGLGYKVEALALVPDSAEPGDHSCQFEITGIMKIPSD